MNTNIRYLPIIYCLLLVAAAHASEPVEKLYATHCASCHGADRLGGIGPALLPENLDRLRLQRRAGRLVRGGRQLRWQALRLSLTRMKFKH